MRMTQDDQIHFLLMCVKHANGGRVNFEAVAQDSQVVSKGAAAKRYERMVAQYGIKENNNTTWDALRSPRERAEISRKPTRSTRRRKLDDSCFNTYADDDDDDDEFDPPPDRKKQDQKPKIKPEPVSNMPMNYPPYMYQHMMPPYPHYIRRPMQPFIAPNSGLNAHYQPSSFQYNQIQPLSSNYNYQMSPQVSPFTMPASLNNAQTPHLGRNRETADQLYQNTSPNYGNFEALLNDPMAVLNGNLLGDEFVQSLQDSNRPSQIEKNHATTVIKTEPTIDDRQKSELAHLNNTSPAHDDKSIEGIDLLPVFEAGMDMAQSESRNNTEPHVKQEESSGSILISD